MTRCANMTSQYTDNLSHSSVSVQDGIFLQWMKLLKCETHPSAGRTLALIPHIPHSNISSDILLTVEDSLVGFIADGRHRHDLCDGVITNLPFPGINAAVRTSSEVTITDDPEIKQCALNIRPYLSCKFTGDTEVQQWVWAGSQILPQKYVQKNLIQAVSYWISLSVWNIFIRNKPVRLAVSREALALWVAELASIKGAVCKIWP